MTERRGSIDATSEGVRLRRAMAPFLAAWDCYDYGQAAQGLARLKPPRHAALRAELQFAQDLSAGFDAWDRFDHQLALQKLLIYRPRIGAQLGLHLKLLEILTSGHDDRRREPLQLIELWHNAQRRAAQGRFDDAVARGYRLLEWTAQWLLRTRAGLDTSGLPPERVPSDLRVSRDASGKIQAGLFAAWELISTSVEGEPATFFRAEARHLQDYVSIRNQSILAHGFVPIDSSMWERFHGWMSDRFLPFLLEQSKREGLRFEPPQLPISLPG